MARHDGAALIGWIKNDNGRSFIQLAANLVDFFAKRRRCHMPIVRAFPVDIGFQQTRQRFRAQLFEGNNNESMPVHSLYTLNRNPKQPFWQRLFSGPSDDGILNPSVEYALALAFRAWQAAVGHKLHLGRHHQFALDFLG